MDEVQAATSPRWRRRFLALAAVAAVVAAAVVASAGRGTDAGSELTTAGDDPIACPPETPEKDTCLYGPTSTTVPDTIAPDLTPTTTLPSTPVPTPRLEGSDVDLAVAVDIASPTAAAGEIVRFTIRATEPSSRQRAVGSDFGDGTPRGLPGTPHVHCPTSTTSAVAGPPEEGSETYEHAYRLPGVYKVRFRVVSAGCNGPSRRVDLVGTVIVGPGVLLTNGPVPPFVVGASQVLPEQPSTTVDLNVHVKDLDGYVSSVVIGWGDGTPDSTKSYSQSGCTDPRSRWPGPSSDTFVDRHSYSASGAYNVTITVVSMGCTGADRQASTKTVTVQAGS